MAKKQSKQVYTIVKLQIPAAKATPAPPIGPALGQHGVNIMDFCKAYNAKTADKGNTVIPVEITIYTDKSFTFILKTPPTSVLILQALGQEKGASRPNTNIIGVLTKLKLEEIAKTKMPDLNCIDLEAAKMMVAGSARSMGVKLES